MCTARRGLVYRQATSKESATTTTAILAGLGVATDLMFLKLVRPLDALQYEFTKLRIFLIADDVRLGMQDHSETKLAKNMEAATERAIQLLEEEEHMQVSRGPGGKTVALCSSTGLRRKVGARLVKKGITMEKATRNLGVDFALGKGNKKRLIQRKRWQIVQRREVRVRRVGGRAGARVAVTGHISSMTYGVDATGMSDGMLAALRSYVSRARGRCKGRSTTARLLMEGVDPGVRVVTGLVMQWVIAWWDQLVDRDVMRMAWRHAVISVGMAARPNVKVQGGGGGNGGGAKEIHVEHTGTGRDEDKRGRDLILWRWGRHCRHAHD